MSAVPGSLYSMPQPWQGFGNYGPTSNSIMGIDPNQANPFTLTSPATSGNWMDSFTKAGPMSNMSFDAGPQLNFGQQINQYMKDSGFLGTKEDPGWGGMALGAAGGLASAFMGMKQYGLAKETLANNKQQFAAQYDAQKKMTNSAMDDRQRARVASNPGAYESVGSYMAKNGVA